MLFKYEGLLTEEAFMGCFGCKGIAVGPAIGEMLGVGEDDSDGCLSLIALLVEVSLFVSSMGI